MYICTCANPAQAELLHSMLLCYPSGAQMNLEELCLTSEEVWNGCRFPDIGRLFWGPDWYMMGIIYKGLAYLEMVREFPTKTCEFAYIYDHTRLGEHDIRLLGLVYSLEKTIRVLGGPVIKAKLHRALEVGNTNSDQICY